VHWTEKDTSTTGYYVFRSASGGDFTQAGHITSRTTTTFNDTGLSSDTPYTYKIEAYSGVGTSVASSTVAVTTPLITPSALTAAATSGTSADLNWTDNDTSAAGYYVFRASDGTHFSQIANLNSGDAATFTDTTLTSGHAYTYEIQAYSGSITSPVSKSAKATTPLASPSRLSATAQSSTVVALSWADNDTSAVGYYVLRSTDGTHYSQLTKIASSTATSYTDKAASALKKFYYEVEAYSAATISPASEPSSASTPLTIPGTAASTAISRYERENHLDRRGCIGTGVLRAARDGWNAFQPGRSDHFG